MRHVVIIGPYMKVSVIELNSLWYGVFTILLEEDLYNAPLLF